MNYIDTISWKDMQTLIEVGNNIEKTRLNESRRKIILNRIRGH